jgi:hypothetical protein
LEKVLRSFGLSVYADHHSLSERGAPAPKVLESNLNELASNAASEGFELLFFPQLRQELKRKLDQSPNVLRFHGLRDCVKQLAGAGVGTAAAKASMTKSSIFSGPAGKPSRPGALAL